MWKLRNFLRGLSGSTPPIEKEKDREYERKKELVETFRELMKVIKEIEE